MKIKLAALGFLITGIGLNVQAVDLKAGAALAQQRACTACHAVDKKVVGPAFKDVAKKYKGNAAAEQALASKVKKGGGGVWGNIPMPANNVTEAEAKQLVQWVLAQ